MKTQSIGHSAFKLDFDGRVFLTDPCFTNSGIPYYLFMRRIYPLGIDPDSIANCDVILVSHNHPDHLSTETFEIARRLGSTIIGPRTVVRRARRNKVANCISLRPGETYDLTGIRITAVPAMHPPLKNAIGFLVEGSRNMYFSGDTRFDWSIVDALKGRRIDIAFLQVACSFRTFRQGADGMDVNYAAEMAKAIRPKCVIPMHFDCVGRYLDLFSKKRVTEHSLEVEDALSIFERKLSKNNIECVTIFAGGSAEL